MRKQIALLGMMAAMGGMNTLGSINSEAHVIQKGFDRNDLPLMPKRSKRGIGGLNQRQRRKKARQNSGVVKWLR